MIIINYGISSVLVCSPNDITLSDTDPHHISLNNDMYCPFTYYIAIISIH